MDKQIDWLSTTPEHSKFTLDIKNDPYGWIQFKGSDLCMDVHCKCGFHSHIDAEFLYFVRCPKCGTVYELNAHIQLIERPDQLLQDDGILQTAE